MAEVDLETTYPNSGEWFDQPESRVEEAASDKAKLSQAKPFVQDVLKRFKERRKYYNSLDAIPGDPATMPPAVHQQYVEAHRLVRDILQQEIDYITALVTNVE